MQVSDATSSPHRHPRCAASCYCQGDERIIGDGGLVEQVLSQANEAFERKYRLKVKGIDVDRIADRVVEMVGIGQNKIIGVG